MRLINLFDDNVLPSHEQLVYNLQMNTSKRAIMKDQITVHLCDFLCHVS